MKTRDYRHLLVIVMTGCLLVTAEASSADRKDGRGSDQRVQLDPELQQAVDQTALEYRKKYYQDDLLQGYVNELGQSLVPKELPAGVLFSFRVIDDPIPNAVALPDGRIFIHSGLLAFVDNEAQLATILGHEIAHVVENHTVEAIRAATSLKRGLLGALVGGVVGGLTKSKEAADLAMSLTMAVQSAAFSRKQEDEADLAGCRYAMFRGFDPRTAVQFFDKLTTQFGEQGRLSNLLFGTHSLNKDRARNIEKLLAGDLAQDYNKFRGEGKLTVSTGQFRFFASGMVRDTAIRLAEVYDRYDLAKERLESIVDVRPRDPKTLWHLGRIYRLVARTEEDKRRSLEFLERAVQADERALYPEIHRDLGLMLATRAGDSTRAAESLRKYVAGYVAHYRRHPPDLAQIYDYLLMFGDSKWTAPEVPRQLLIEVPERVAGGSEESVARERGTGGEEVPTTSTAGSAAAVGEVAPPSPSAPSGQKKSRGAKPR
ncbi:MAG TPA: M48 family metalloprotease [Bryobacteraceae bacterium]|nr:M48 family metalloprotease [Bryobacteraceae bacterium]